MFWFFSFLVIMFKRTKLKQPQRTPALALQVTMGQAQGSLLAASGMSVTLASEISEMQLHQLSMF